MIHLQRFLAGVLTVLILSCPFGMIYLCSISSYAFYTIIAVTVILFLYIIGFEVLKW